MKFGLDVGIYGRLATPEIVIGLAQQAEAADFDSVWLADHVVFPSKIESKYPYNPTGAFPVPGDEPVLEPIATMGVLVGATKRVKIGTAVLVMPYRNPVVLGKMLATYDVFSGGRIILGAGVGWLEEEFVALDARSFRDRGPVTDEYIEVVKRVCGGGEVSFDGEHYQLAPAHAYPASISRPHPPILIGGTSNPALRRTARLSNGWLSVALLPDMIGERLNKLREYCAEYNRNFDELSLYHKLFVNIGKARPSVFGSREPGTGTQAEIIDDIKRIADFGFQNFIVRYLGTDENEQREQLDRFASDIMPKV